jgi:hypothetical protein
MEVPIVNSYSHNSDYNRNPEIINYTASSYLKNRVYAFRDIIYIYCSQFFSLQGTTNVRFFASSGLQDIFQHEFYIDVVEPKVIKKENEDETEKDVSNADTEGDLEEETEYDRRNDDDNMRIEETEREEERILFSVCLL